MPTKLRWKARIDRPIGTLATSPGASDGLKTSCSQHRERRKAVNPSATKPSRLVNVEFPKPGRDSNYLKTIKSTLDLRKTCAAKIHLQQKCDFCFHRCSPKMHFQKKMHNVRVRKYTRSRDFSNTPSQYTLQSP